MISKKKYILCDLSILKNRQITLKNFLEYYDNLDIDYIQYIDNISSLETQKKNLLFLKSNTNISVIINNKLELLEYCDGLHLEQDSLQEIIKKEFKIKDTTIFFKLLRKKYPTKIFGVSISNEIEILQANKLDIDYIGMNISNEFLLNTSQKQISYLSKISKHTLLCNVTNSDLYEN